GAAQPALRLACGQARQVERHRLRPRWTDPGHRRRPDEPRGRRPLRRHESRAAAGRLGGRVGRLLSLPRRPGSRGCGRGDGGHPAGRIGEGSGRDRRRRPAGHGHGLHRHPALPALKCFRSINSPDLFGHSPIAAAAAKLSPRASQMPVKIVCTVGRAAVTQLPAMPFGLPGPFFGPSARLKSHGIPRMMIKKLRLLPYWLSFAAASLLLLTAAPGRAQNAPAPAAPATPPSAAPAAAKPAPATPAQTAPAKSEPAPAAAKTAGEADAAQPPDRAK